jgi:hypothetical protein
MSEVAGLLGIHRRRLAELMADKSLADERRRRIAGTSDGRRVQHQEPLRHNGSFPVEVRGFEPLTPTLRTYPRVS